MKKPIKVVQSNEAALAAALDAVNGTASMHTYSAYDILALLAPWAEKQVLKLVPKSAAAGAVVEAVSGNSVAKAYKYSRKATYVRIERRSSAWYLVEVRASEIGKSGGYAKVQLTAAQDAEAVARLRRSYSIAAAPGDATPQ